jgi:hypothetical protein
MYMSTAVPYHLQSCRAQVDSLLACTHQLLPMQCMATAAICWPLMILLKTCPFQCVAGHTRAMFHSRTVQCTVRHCWS